MLRSLVIISLVMFSVSVLSVSAEVWRDSFDVGTFGEEWEPAVSVAGNPPSDWKIEDGVLKGYWATLGLQLLLMEYHSLDYTIQVRCRVDSGSNPEGGGGIAFRSSAPGQPGGWQSTSDFYMFAIHRTGFRLHRIGTGWWDSPVIEQPMGDAREHSEDDWYTLKLEAKGNDIKGYVNDELLFEIEDDAFDGGFVGVFTGMFTDVSFDDFAITDQDDSLTSGQGGPSSVSSEGKTLTTWAGIKRQ